MPVTKMFIEHQSQADAHRGRIVCETQGLHRMDQNHDTGADPQGLISVRDYERLAVQRMAPGPHGYYAGGAGDEVTLADNEAAWGRLAIAPRMLVGVGERDTSVTVLGVRRPHPLVIAPMAFQALATPEAEAATAWAANQTGTVMCLSTLATTSPAALAHAVPEASRWFQLYVFSDRGVSRELVAQAVEHGYEALVVTVDLPAFGRRERDLRTGVSSASAAAVASAAAAGARGAMTPADFADLVDPDLRWEDIERFAAESPLPVLVKGILTPRDAELAALHGAAGVVVSNHGGRQLDTVLSGADAVGPVVDAVGDRVEVLVDGGIRRGIDVLKALALGARAVLVGRPVLWGLAVGGAAGARDVLEILIGEFDLALALAGAPRAAGLDRSFVMPAPWAAG
jgi:isopentenyl diphosphate isomerase/L-lactate dehydrogenase-like FMN-dependent dehydrogenase